MEMDFHGMKRKDLQTLCKKHGIPANLKNIEMATRLASVLKKEDEETVIETKCSIEDGSIEEENLVDIRKAKRVRFSPESENQVFEFSRSVKKLQRKIVKKRSQGTSKDLRQGRNVEPRRSKRIVSKGITVAGSSGNESISVIVETDKKAHKVPRRSKRIRSSGIAQEEYDETDLIGLEQFEDKEIQDGLVFEKVGRRSTRLAAKTTKSCVDGGTSKSGTLLPAKERTMQSCETKTAEPIMISENVLDSTSKVSVDVSLVRNTQELNSEVMEEVREEKHEQDTVMMTKNNKEVASSLSEVFVETTQPSSSVQLEVSNPESELAVRTGHVLVKDTAEENIETEEVPKSVHSFVAKLAETDAVLENSAECWNESLPSKDDERGSLEKEEQSANQHGNFSEYITENSSAEEQGDICKVGRISAGHCVSRETLNEVNGDSQTKFVPTISSERGCKPNALVQDGSLSTGFTSLSSKEEKVSECLEEDESLMLMEQLSESGKFSAADIVTQHNDKAVQSHAVVFTTPEQLLLLGDSRIDEVGKEEEHTATDFPNESDVHNTSQSEAINAGESTVVELHDESNVAASPLRQSSVGDFKGDGIERNEEIRTVELHCVSGTCTSLNRHAFLGSFVSDGAENSGGSKATEFCEENKAVELQVECDLFTGAEKHLLLETDEGMKGDNRIAKSHDMSDVLTASESHSLTGDFEPNEAENKYRENKDVEFKDESAFFTRLESHLLLGEAGQDQFGHSEHQSHRASSPKAVLENSAECWNQSLHDERGSLEKEKQSANQHGNFSEYNTESSSAEEQADICTIGHCVSRETLDEVNDDSQTKFVPTMFSERGCKPNALELLSTDFASLSPKEENISECLEEDELKDVSQPIPINKAASNAIDRSFVFTTPERNLLLMEQLSESGKISAADIVTHHNDEAVESHAVVYTIPGLDEVGKEEEHTTTDFLDESDVHNTSQSEAINEGESIVVELHDESDIAASPLRQSSVGDFKGDGIEQNEEIRTVELHCESGTCTSPNRHALSDGAENSGGSKAMEFYEESDVFTGLEERHEIFEYSGQCTDREGKVKKAAQFDEEAGLSTGMHKDSSDKSDLCMSMERRLLYGDSEQKKTVKTAEEAAAEFHDESAVPNISARHPFPEESELEEAEKSEENKAMELQVDCDLFTSAEKHLLLETDEGIKGDNRVAKSHDMSDILTASESHSLIGDLEPNEAEQKYRENKDVGLLSESNISTNLERHLLSEGCGLASCLESFVFSSAERQHHLGNSEPHTAGKEVEFPDESHVLNTSQSEAINGGKSIIVELRDESDIAASPLRQSSVGDFKGDGIEQNEENRTVELHCESGNCTSLDKHALLGSFVSDGAENSGGSKAMKFYEESDVFIGLEERHEISEYSGQLLYVDSEQKKAVKTAEEAAAEFHDEFDVPNNPARHPFQEESELEEAEKSKENKAVELQVECDLFTSAEKHLLLETDEGMNGDNRIAKSQDMSNVLTASESHSLIGDFEPNEAENKYRENKDVELLSESDISPNLERHLTGGCGLGGTREIATCVESFVFSPPERLHHLGNSELHIAGKEDESAFFTRLESRLLLRESGQDRLGNSTSGSSQYQIHHASSPGVILKDVSALDVGENIIAGGATPGAEFKPKFSQAENVAGLDATQGTPKQSRCNSPHVDSVNLFDYDIEVADTTMDAERTASFSSYVLALPAKGNSETVGEITSPLKVSGTSTLMSEESRPSTNIQNQINDELVEKLAITDRNEVDEFIESNSTQRDHKGNLMLHYSGGSSVSGKTCILDGTDDEHLGCSSQEDLRNTCEKSGHRILEDEANGAIATAFVSTEKNISLTPNEFTVQDNINKEEGDSETTGEISSHLEVGGTCSMVSDIQNQINETLEELATNNNEADELTKAKSMKSVDSSGGSSVPGMTCFLAGTEHAHLGFTKDEATDPIATTFEKDISLTPDGFLNKKNEEDEEMVRREATPSPEETLNRKEYVDIDESGTSCEKKVRREPILIYRTQVKPKRHEDMKENAPNSKIVDNLNVTAPRTSKRQPLQDLRKN